MQGQVHVYVPVEANAADVMLMDAAGSQGEFKGDYTILWKKDGGVTGVHGWPDGYTPTETSTVEEINTVIAKRWEEVGEDRRNDLFGQWFPVCARLK